MAEALGKQSAQKGNSPLESLAQKKRRLKQFFWSANLKALATESIGKKQGAQKNTPARLVGRVRYYTRSKSRTSAYFTPVSSTVFSAEIGAPPPSARAVPFSLTLPRSTCT